MKVADIANALYPRVRGANCAYAVEAPRSAPLPPRARGKQSQRSGLSSAHTSTPACAGQTIGRHFSLSLSCLYPRVRGANPTAPRPPAGSTPLPPRARGKLFRRLQPADGEASTPACAGQTTCSTRPGGTVGPLPPRARGKHAADQVKEGDLASTPACAGQTNAFHLISFRHSLYPRVRGANNPLLPELRPEEPLPPRARGKHLRNRTIQRDLTLAHLASHSLPTRWLPPERDTRRPRPLGRQQPHRR